MILGVESVQNQGLAPMHKIEDEKRKYLRATRVIVVSEDLLTNEQILTRYFLDSCRSE